MSLFVSLVAHVTLINALNSLCLFMSIKKQQQQKDMEDKRNMERETERMISIPVLGTGDLPRRVQVHC